MCSSSKDVQCRLACVVRARMRSTGREYDQYECSTAHHEVLQKGVLLKDPLE